MADIEMSDVLSECSDIGFISDFGDDFQTLNIDLSNGPPIDVDGGGTWCPETTRPETICPETMCPKTIRPEIIRPGDNVPRKTIRPGDNMPRR